MPVDILMQYGWVLLVLIGLEGLLAADNAIVLAIMVKHLPPKQRKKALFYGLLGAFIFRFISLFLIAILVHAWYIQALGALYLLYISVTHLYHFFKDGDEEDTTDKEAHANEQNKGSGFWMTVLKIELADIAFAIDSMLAAVAIAMTLPEFGPEMNVNLFGLSLHGMNTGQFTVMLLGGLIGVIIMRFAANWFVKVLAKYPGLEAAAFAIVGWVGIKLVVLTLAHKDVGILPEQFPHSLPWEITFWSVLIGLIVIGYLTSKKQNN